MLTMTTTTSPNINLPISSSGTIPSGLFEAFIEYTNFLEENARRKGMKPWDALIDDCGTHFFSRTNRLGDIGYFNNSCGLILCPHDNCKEDRKSKFSKAHPFLSEKNIEIIKVKDNDFYSTEGIIETFKELDRINERLKKTEQKYVLLAGKTKMWLVRPAKSFFPVKQKTLEELINDYTDFSDVINKDARETIMKDFKGYRRIRYHNIEKIKKVKQISTVEKDRVRYALELKAHYTKAEKCKKMQKIVFVDVRIPMYATYYDTVVTYDELMGDPDKYSVEIQLFFGNKFFNKLMSEPLN